MLETFTIHQRREAAVVQHSNALVFDRRHVNRRPVFILKHQFSGSTNGDWQCEREWQGTGSEPVVVEHSRFERGVLHVRSSLPSLNESSSAIAEEQGHCATTLSSHKTGGVLRRREIQLPHQAVALGTMPLFIASNWSELMYGRRLHASYLVLKVQRAATVRVEKIANNNANESETTIAVTPTNLLFKMIFGSTLFVFAADAPRLIRIDGLLDPRDRKPNGRWHEYMGRIEYDVPIDLSVLCSSPASTNKT